jgi:hypothetical protein
MGINNSAAANSNLAGFQAATVLNPDMIGELRVIISPVDAEMDEGTLRCRSSPVREPINIEAAPYGLPRTPR